MRNLQEGRHDLARHVFHGRRGDLRRAYHDGMEDQLGALGQGRGIYLRDPDGNGVELRTYSGTP